MATIALLKLPEVLALRAKKTSAFYADIRSGLFPAPIKRSVKDAVWPDYEVAAIAAAEIASTPPAEIRALVQQLVAQRSKVAA